jgi:hypothetical protein
VIFGIFLLKIMLHTRLHNEMPKIIIPKNISLKQYMKDRVVMSQGVANNAIFREGYLDAFLPFVCIHPESEIKKLIGVQETLRRAVIKIVSNYFSDVDIQKSIPLSKDIADELKSLNSEIYDVGLIRPDFLFSKKGENKICEINARFTLNAFFMTSYVNDLYIRLYPNFSGLEHFKLFKKKADDVFKGDKIAIIKGREHGYDIHSLLLEYKDIKLCPLKNIKKILKNNNTVVLELHQDELAPYLGDVCRAIKGGVRVINDPRTIFIAHDKRILSVLSDKGIMKKYLNSRDVATLQRYIIQTFSKGASSLSKTAYENARNKKDSWVVKKAIGGKSDGLYTGKLKSQREWNDALKSKDIVLQPYIEQKKFECWNPYTQQYNDFYLAGTLPQWDEQCYGPGLYRMYDSLKEKFCFFIQPMVEMTKKTKK